MEIEISNTKEDYKDFYKYYYFKRTILFRIFISFGLGIIFYGREITETRVNPSNTTENLLQIFIIGTIAFVLITLVPYFIGIIRLTAVNETTKSPEGKKTFRITETGLQINSETENVFWNWESIRLAEANSQIIYLFIYSRRLYILPLKYFSSEKEFQSFLGALQNNIIRLKPGSPQRKVWQLYWWGLLGFIPIVGAITGLVLLILGLFIHKNKYLILIGVCCILFTIGIFFQTNRKLDKNIEDNRSTFQSISQKRLNNLMKEVEFYKLQYGSYPSSLEEIKRSNRMASTEDPLQLRNHNPQNNKYIYIKVGEKYYLFSSGQDGMPNTADDFFPTITSSDSSKFGLIKHN